MAWKTKSAQNGYGETGRTYEKNEQCFIRKDHECGKIFGASSSCFVACPNEDDIAPLLVILTEKLAKQNIEVSIAVKERVYGKDIFCTKICGKIIEAKFCVVILDDRIDNDITIPNPNVYYEYGLMTALKKHIIPLQKEELKLAFNIQSYDTIKYTNKNMGPEIDDAIIDAIRNIESKPDFEKTEFVSEKSILRSFELSDYEIKTGNWVLNDIIEDTGFIGMGYKGSEFYVYLGKIETEKELANYIDDTRMVIYRTEKKVKELELEIRELEEKSEKASDNNFQVYSFPTFGSSQSGTITYKQRIANNKSIIENLSVLYIAYIINPNINPSDFLEKISEFSSGKTRYKIVANSKNIIGFNGVEVNLAAPKLRL